MKKILFSAIAAIGLLLSPGCSDDNEVVSGGNDSLVSFSVGLENGIQTKAISDGKTAKNLVVGVYEKIGESYEEIPALRHKETNAFRTTTADGKPKAEVTFNLVKGKTYHFIFWAQAQAVDGSEDKPFDIRDLRDIKVDYEAANCNDEARDAFVGVVKDLKVSGTYEKEVTLKRPFAQLNFLVTKDELKAADKSTNLELKQSQITLSQAAKMLHPFTNTVEDLTAVDATVTFKPTAIPMLSNEYNSVNYQTHPEVGNPTNNVPYYYLATTYFLVPAAGADDNAGKARTTLSSVNLKLANDEGTLAEGPGFTAHTVPVQWNYRTNIYGSLLTADGQFNVEIVPDFNKPENPDNNVEQPQTVMVATVADVPQAIADGATKVSIQEVPTAAPAEADQMVPKIFADQNDKKIEIEFQKPLPAGYTITYSTTTAPTTGTAEGTYAPAEVHFTAPSTEASNLVIDLTESTVTVNGTYRNIEASTARNTLIVPSGTTIEHLKVNQGNVKIFGTGLVKEIEKANGYQGTITYNISTAEQLSGLATAINAGNNDLYTMLGKVDAIHLENDIDLNKAEWEPIGTKDKPFKFTFDGQDHTISNLSINKPTDAYVGLFGDLNTPGKIQNVKIENASVKGQSQVGALVGASYTGTISNCTVSGKIQIEGNYQVGGLAGQGYAQISGCAVIGNSGSYVKGVYEKNNLEGDAVGGIIGYYREDPKTLANCTASINVEGTRKVGGLAGQIGDNVTVDGCKFTGTVSTNASDDYIVGKQIWVGGIVGEASSTPVTLQNNTITSGSVVIGRDPATTGLIIGGSREANPSINQSQGNTSTGAIMQVAIASGVTLVNGVYTISSVVGLKWLATTVNAGTKFSGKTVKLANDIDLNNEEWTPIGQSGASFEGIFDGDNHTISNLKITDSRKSDVGLFGITKNGEVKNFTLHNASVKGRLDVGAVAGTPYTSTYTNIKLTGVVKIDGYAYVGGMFGKNAYANLTDLTIYVTADSYVKADSKGFRTYVGGLVGFMGEGGQTVSNVTSNINVTGSTCDVGGITGIAHYGNTFENCTCTGNVTLTGASDAGDQLEIGGIAGVWHNENGTTVTFRNCAFTGVLKTFLDGVDCSAAVAESNKITGKQYLPDGTGRLVIE